MALDVVKEAFSVLGDEHLDRSMCRFLAFMVQSEFTPQLVVEVRARVVMEMQHAFCYVNAAALGVLVQLRCEGASRVLVQRERRHPTPLMHACC